MNNNLDVRRHLYHQFSPQLAQLDDTQITTLLKGIATPHIWGTNGVISAGGRRFFVKRVPVTELEREGGSTSRNIYRLPTYYNYGLGSAGCSAYRQILAHTKTNHWVLDGALENFPLLYHHRIIPLHNQLVGQNMDGLAGYVQYWNGNKNIEKLLVARANARCEAVLFFEFIPHAMWKWLGKHIDQLPELVEQMRQTFAFLRQNNLVHFDAHLGNVLTDGNRFYLTDFEIAISQDWTLHKRERVFLQRHRHFDCGNFLSAVCNYIYYLYRDLTKTKKAEMARRFDAREEMSYRPLSILLLEQFEEIHASGIMDLPAHFVAAITQYSDIAAQINAFFYRMATSNRKDAQLDPAALRRMLKAVQFI